MDVTDHQHEASRCVLYHPEWGEKATHSRCATGQAAERGAGITTR
jgi:hypothetical protein